MGGMEPLVELDLGDLRLRTLTLADDDAALLVEATRAASASALWGPRPAGPYSLEAARSALQAWDPHHGRQVSFGVLDGPRLVAALGLMPDGPHSAELAYWVRPEDRRRGIALRSVQALTSWARRVWQRLRHMLLDQLGRDGRIDWSRASVDALSVRAKRGAR
jgi:RimJ/RimL family protein N-acetyltransferase